MLECWRLECRISCLCAHSSLLLPFMVSVGMPGKLHLNDVASLFDVDVLFHLKEEFGGLQTVFRNHRQVFKGLSVIVNAALVFHMPVLMHCFEKRRQLWEGKDESLGRQKCMGLGREVEGG